MPLIYRKTTKGLAEIETRAQRLLPRLRSLLILVDGRRNVDDIRVMIQQPTEEALQSLAMQGFIEVLGDPAGAAAASSIATTTPAQRPVAGPGSFHPRVLPVPVPVQAQVPQRAAARAARWRCWTRLPRLQGRPALR